MGQIWTNTFARLNKLICQRLFVCFFVFLNFRSRLFRIFLDAPLSYLVANGVEGINGLMLSNAMHLSCWKKKEVTLPLSHKDEVAFHKELMKKVKSSKRKENVSATVSDTSGSYNN